MKMSDSQKHVAVCCALAVLTLAVARAMGSWLPKSLALAVIFVMMVGVMKELADAFEPGNAWDWHDIAADAVGCVAGTAIGSLFWLF